MSEMPIRPIHVLHVGDDSEFVDVAARRLEHESGELSVETVTDIAEAFDRLEGAPDVDCIVSDIRVDGEDGVEFLASVRAERPNLPFILFTGEGSEEIASEAIAAGVTDYIRKVTGENQYAILANRIRNAVGRTRAEDRRRRDLRVIETAREGISLLDRDGRFTYVNGAYADIYGYDPEDLLDEHWKVLYPDDERAIVDDEILPAVASDGHWRGETIGVRSDGSTIVEDHSVAATDDDGLICIVRDVTERKAKAEQLRALHEATRRLITAQTPTAVAEIATDVARDVVGLPSNVVYVYDEYRDVLTPGSVTSEAEALFDDLPTVGPDEGALWEVFETGQRQTLDDPAEVSELIQPETPVRVVLALPLGEHGVFVAGSTSTDAFDDRTRSIASVLTANVEAALDRVHNLQHLRRRERDLMRTNTVLSTLLENLPIGILAEDSTRRIIAANPSFCEIHDMPMSPDELIGYDCAAFAEEAKDAFAEPDAFVERIEEILERREPVASEETLLADGRIVERTYAPYALPDGGANLWLFRDVTERKKHERELERQNERLGAFARLVSHDLRNPLNVAQGNLELVHDECESERIDRIASAHDRMKQLIDDILTLARHGQSVDEPTPIELDHVTDRAWATVDTADATISIDADAIIHGDDGRVQRLFENLFRNAVDHGGTDVAIRVGTLEDGTGFYVEDDGPGIPEPDRKRVFESGYSTSAEGTGFGLAIVDEIANAHGWTITVTDGVDGGARFEIVGVDPT